MEKLQGLTRTTIHMQKTFMRKQIKLKLGGVGSELEPTLADVYEKQMEKSL